MSLRSQLVTFAFATLGALLLFHSLHRQMLGLLPGSRLAAELVPVLEQSQTDLRRLAQAHPARGPEYRARFDAQQALANRLRIVAHNGEAIAKRQQSLVLAAATAALLAFAAALLVASRRDTRRLRRVSDALARLASGERDIRLADHGRDHIGVFARMIERTSDVISRDRQRLASLRHLQSWQEAARRHAHELRTPLTVLRLDAERLQAHAALPDELRRPLDEIRGEVLRLEEHLRRFAAFARLPVPERRMDDLREVVLAFAETFANAWPGVRLVTHLPDARCPVRIDRAMIRQVLVNLCDNAARALAGREGELRLVLRPASGGSWTSLDVSDDGPGVSEEVRARLFEPYVTTAPPGQGMGLGLVISRKILLDHGGDLEILDGSPGATFRLSLPSEAPCRA